MPLICQKLMSQTLGMSRTSTGKRSVKKSRLAIDQKVKKSLRVLQRWKLSSRLFGVPKKSQYVLKKLEIYEALDQDPQPSQTFEFPTQADFDQVEDKQNIRLAEITAVKEFSKNLVSLSLKLTDGTNSSLLGCQKPKQKNSFTTYRTNFKVREI